MTSRFTVVRALGSGGQGRVVAVRDSARGGRTVALKETPAARAHELEREFVLLTRLRHPNLAAVYDWFAESPLAEPSAAPPPAAYSQEWVDGVDLWRALRDAPLALREACFEQVLRALAYLHAVDVVHLDMKPENVMVAGEGADLRVRVLDFGIAESGERTTGVVRGSMSYIAPERLALSPFDQRADLYALGVMMAEVWLGHPPPRGALMGALSDPEARRAWLREIGVPASWQRVVTALTSQDPADRPSSVARAAAMWARDLGRPLTLHTPGTVAAMLRAGPPAGREAELARCAREVRRGGAIVATGRGGSGRRTLLRAAGHRAQVAGHDVEWWLAPRTLKSLADALGRLTRDPRLAETLASLPAPPATSEEAYAAWVKERAAEMRQHVLELEPRAPRPVLVVESLETAPRLVQALVAELVEVAEEAGSLPVSLLVSAEAHAGPAAQSLKPLDREAVEALVKSRLGASAATSRLGATLAAATGGHPLHLETLLGLLVARGALRFRDEGWLWTGDAELDLPADMDEAVHERVALLSEDKAQVLGAVSWLRFPARGDEVDAVCGGASGVSQAATAELAAAGLVWITDDGRVRVAHRAVDEALAAWQPPGGEAAAHERVLERAQPEGLARAWHLGGEPGRALALQIAQDRREDGLLEEAAEALDLALELDPEDAEALSARAGIANLLGPRELQVRCLEALLDVLPDVGPERLDALQELFWALTRIGDAQRAEQVGREVLVLARMQGDRRALAEGLVHLANVVIQRGDWGEGERLLTEAMERAEALDEPSLRARTYNNLGNVHAYRDAHDKALELYARAHALKVAEGDPVGQRIALGNMGLMCLKLTRYAEALSHFAASLNAARQTGHRRGEAWCLLALAVLGLEGGAVGYAGRRAALALEVAESLGDRLIACDAQSTQAEVALAAGEAFEARRLATSALARAEAVESAFNAAGAQVVLAATWLDEDPEKAASLAAEAWAAEASDEVIRASAARVEAEAAVRRGDLDAAEAAARRALAVGGRGLTARVLETVEQVLQLVGDLQGAQSVRDTARSVLAQRAASWPERALADGVDDAAPAAEEGPSRRTFEAQAEVARVLSGADEGGGTMADEKATIDAGGSRWTRAAAQGDGEALVGAAGEWLVAAVEALGAERAFVVGADHKVVAAKDVDGEDVGGAHKKVPEAVLNQVRETGKPYVASGSGGRGSVAGFPVRGGRGRARAEATLVLQNRFVGSAFDPLLESPPDVTPLATLLRLKALEDALEAAVAEVRQAEDKRRSELTRSTEEILRLRRELETTREQVGPLHAYPEIVFASSAMRKMLRRLDRVVASDLPVYVYGESGTGKELVARAIHAHGHRKKGPFVAQNCSAVPTTLFESEFFGHEKGAFTGAERKTEGLFRRADRGTLFLDEIGDLPLDLQAKLLRVLETSEVRPVGGRSAHRVDVRIICATHRDLKDQVAKGEFREDLFYRLNVVRIDVPPLRDRPDDVPVLVNHFLERRAADIGKAITLGAGVMKALIAHDWPGNVRQLENEITRAALLSDGEVGLDDLSPEVREARRASRAGGRGGGASAGSSPVVDTLGLARGTLKERVDRLEAWVLEDALERLGGNKSQVARELGLSRAGLNMKLKRLDLWPGD